jgi:hypothetical protein
VSPPRTAALAVVVLAAVIMLAVIMLAVIVRAAIMRARVMRPGRGCRTGALGDLGWLEHDDGRLERRRRNWLRALIARRARRLASRLGSGGAGGSRRLVRGEGGNGRNGRALGPRALLGGCGLRPAGILALRRAGPELRLVGLGPRPPASPQQAAAVRAFLASILAGLLTCAFWLISF